MSAPPFDSADRALTELFGYASFRPGQREVIDAVLDGRDLLAVMPTGSGKSLCYQLPAALLDGTVLVVSPLIALMKDQVDALGSVGLSATCVNSSLSRRQRRQRLERVRSGDVRLLYVAPERFQSESFRDTLAETQVSLLAVDEAHCISHWGHDFRPDYLELGTIREELDHPPVLALTATATRRVRRDILEQLGIEDADVVLGGFERPNLHFDVHRAPGDREKIEHLGDLLASAPSASTVVYCATRKQVEEVAGKLRDAGLVAGGYHAGLDNRRRQRVQEDFMAGDLPVLVATNAFGMGVDKSDIRAIVHYNHPGSLEAYYQQAGRAGRDGEPAYCLMLYSGGDRDIHDFFIENSHPERTVVEAVWREVSRDGPGERDVTPDELANLVSRSSSAPEVHPWAVETALDLLGRGGHLEVRGEGSRQTVVVEDRARLRDLRVDWEKLEQQREIDERLLEDVIKYATGKSCRQGFLCHYFGTEPSFGDHCGNCDTCGADPPELERHESDSPASDDEETVARKLLSGIARLQTDGGRRTRLEVAALLRGSTLNRPGRAGWDDLSTHGALDYLGPHELVGGLDQCLAAELATNDETGLELTERGADVMTGDRSPPPELHRWCRRLFDRRGGSR
ncbi:MAG: ATP-dependent DNA helicase RecQ [Bradymonadaceae bacterium]